MSSAVGFSLLLRMFILEVPSKYLWRFGKVVGFKLQEEKLDKKNLDPFW